MTSASTKASIDAAGQLRRARPRPVRSAPARKNCASASRADSPASSPRSARTWSTASRCTSTSTSNDFGGAKVKLIVEDEQGKPDTAVTKAKKLILQDKVHMFVGGLLASTGYALAPVSTAEKTSTSPSIPAADDLTQRQLDKYPVFDPHQLDELAAAAIRSASGPASRATRRSSPIAPTTPSATRSSAASRRRSRIAAARSSRRSGRRSAPRTSGPTSRPSRRTPTRSSR